ncbi:unnamed protein product, partial [Didymodactylos carnosus]
MEYQSFLQAVDTSGTTEKYMFDKSHFKTFSTDILPLVPEFFKQQPGDRNLENAPK